MTSKRKISLEEARQIAEKDAMANIGYFAQGRDHVLQDSYLEAENCWMFFADEAIKIPPEACLGIKWAYAVSKHGSFSMIQDFSYDREKLLDYLQTMSDYFTRKEEPVNP